VFFVSFVVKQMEGRLACGRTEPKLQELGSIKTLMPLHCIARGAGKQCRCAVAFFWYCPMESCMSTCARLVRLRWGQKPSSKTLN
jgi:hypothetical protein